MSNAALVAINLWYNDDHDNTVLLSNSTPMLYYWNMDTPQVLYWNMGQNQSFINTIVHNEKVAKLIEEKVTTLDIYSRAKVSYIYYKISGTNEDYTEDTVYLQSCLNIDEIDGLLDKALDTIAKDAYYHVFHADYIERNGDPIVYDVYAKSNLMNKEQLSVSTFLNYMRSLASRKYKLTNANLDKLHAKAAETIGKSQKYHEHIG